MSGSPSGPRGACLHSGSIRKAAVTDKPSGLNRRGGGIRPTLHTAVSRDHSVLANGSRLLMSSGFWHTFRSPKSAPGPATMATPSPTEDVSAPTSGPPGTRPAHPGAQLSRAEGADIRAATPDRRSGGHTEQSACAPDHPRRPAPARPEATAFHRAAPTRARDLAMLSKSPCAHSTIATVGSQPPARAADSAHDGPCREEVQALERTLDLHPLKGHRLTKWV